MAFWLEFKKEDSEETYVSKSDGLTAGERQAAYDSPNFVREFQGDQFGREYGRSE